MDRPPQIRPEAGPSRSSRGRGGMKSAQPESVLLGESMPSNELSELIPASEVRAMVTESLVDQVLRWAIEAQNRLASAKSEHEKRDMDRWAETLPPAPEARQEWTLQQRQQCIQAASEIVLGGRLLLLRGTQAQYMETHKFYTGKIQEQHLKEVRGQSEWVGASIRLMCQSVTDYQNHWEALQKAWPRDLDLGNLWLVGCSDLSGDQLMILQGDRSQVQAASRGLVPARTILGRESLVTANSISQRLGPLEAAMLIPGAIQEDCLLWLES